MNPTERQIAEAIDGVVRRAGEDAAFREKALKEPVAALNEAGKLDLPPATPIRFVNEADEMVVLLPAFGADPDEITDERMLENISGGFVVEAVMLGILIVGIATTGIVLGDKK